MKRPGRIAIRVGLACGAVLAVAGVGIAQRSARVLHHPIPGDLPVAAAGGELTRPAGAGEIANEGPPGWSPQAHLDEEVLRPRDRWDVPPRTMDQLTRSPAGMRLAYREVFTPAVAPFKRGHAFDMVDELGRLAVRDPSLRPVRVGGVPPAAWASAPRSRFVGEQPVELSATWPTAIPGVAGDQHVVRYATDTGAAVEFARDSAGNLFVRGATAGTVRLTYVIEAPEHAFQPPSLPGMSLEEAARSVPEADRPPVPEWLRTSSVTVLRYVGVTRSMPFDRALGRLVEHFRSFRDADLAEARGADVYTNLAIGGVGACRHRAYAMVPTLHALGIPARYVGNEAHAWVEFWIPRVGWSRMDLGGWDVPLDASAATERQTFRPSNSDPFPQPDRYTSGYSHSTTMAGSGSGGGGGAGTGGGGSTGDGDAGVGGGTGTEGPVAGADGGLATATGGPGSGSSNGGGGGGTSGGANRSGGTASGSGGGGPSRGAGRSDDDVDPPPARAVVTIQVIRGDVPGGYRAANGYVRGSVVLVQGEARDDRGERGVGNLPIEVHLHRGARRVSTLGGTVSQPDGRWEARVQLPPVLEPGPYELRATTPGDATHAATDE